jgi:hypothetical protein
LFAPRSFCWHQEPKTAGRRQHAWGLNLFFCPGEEYRPLSFPDNAYCSWCSKIMFKLDFFFEHFSLSAKRRQKSHFWRLLAESNSNTEKRGNYLAKYLATVLGEMLKAHAMAPFDLFWAFIARIVANTSVLLVCTWSLPRRRARKSACPRTRSTRVHKLFTAARAKIDRYSRCWVLAPARAQAEPAPARTAAPSQAARRKLLT